MNTRQDFEAFYEEQKKVPTTPETEREYAFDEDGINELIKDSLFQVWQAATARQEAKIKVLVEALESFTKSDYIKKQHPVRYKNTVAALAAAKETDLSYAPRGITE